MVPGAGGVPTMQRIPLPGAELLEEEPLYVNAKQYHRILKRRQARAKLEAEGRIPKERRVRMQACMFIKVTVLYSEGFVVLKWGSLVRHETLILTLILTLSYSCPFSTRDPDPKPNSNRNPYPNPNPDPKPNRNFVRLLTLFEFRLGNGKITLTFKELSD